LTMNIFRITLKITFIVILAFSVLTVSALAADFEPEAKKLQELGLFSGTDSGFELDEPATRVQMAVMAVRLLGAEKEALEENNTSPFIDVPAWAGGYVGWLWKNGLIKGTDAQHFSPDLPCDARMYSAVLLRALGYFESSGDFQYNNVIDFALRKGVIDYICWGENGFLRDQMAAMSYWTLGCFTADGSSCLLISLRDKGAVPIEAANEVLSEFSELYEQRRNIPENLRSVKHAAGMIDGYTLTNSLEALESASEAGDSFIELDFCLTCDQSVVCLHHWDYNILTGSEGLSFPLTLEQFLSCRIYGRYSPLSLDDLAQYLAGHPGITIITDVKDNNLTVLKKIAEAYPELTNRFIPQIYSQDEYGKVRSLGFDNIIYTLYNLPMEEKLNTSSISSFASTHRLAGIAFDVSLASADYVAALKESGTPLLVHTVNSENEKEELYSLGINGVYSDY
jgi:glycerophosphoryl diester phosphodiesterase